LEHGDEGGGSKKKGGHEKKAAKVSKQNFIIVFRGLKGAPERTLTSA